MPTSTLTGTGNATIDLDRAQEPALIHITGNAEGKHFSVSAYDPGGRRIDLLVTTVDPYEGIRPLDMAEHDHTTRLQVTAAGPWRIEIWPLTDEVIEARTLIVPGQREGAGDDVLFLSGATPGRLTVEHCTGGHLAIRAYGRHLTLLVNTICPYQGAVELPPDARRLEVKAEGQWKLSTSAAVEKG